MFSRQLGFDWGNKTTGSHFGSVPSDFAMDNVDCSSNDNSIQDCFYKDDTNENCGASQGAGVYCFSIPGKLTIIPLTVSERSNQIVCWRFDFSLKETLQRREK